MFWSMVIPKKLKLVTCSIGLSLIDKLSVGKILGCLKNSINFDLCNVGIAGVPMYTICDYTPCMHFNITTHFVVMKCIYSVIFEARKFSRPPWKFLNTPLSCIYIVHTFLDQIITRSSGHSSSITIEILVVVLLLSTSVCLLNLIRVSRFEMMRWPFIIQQVK